LEPVSRHGLNGLNDLVPGSCLSVPDPGLAYERRSNSKTINERLDLKMQHTRPHLYDLH